MTYRVAGAWAARPWTMACAETDGVHGSGMGCILALVSCLGWAAEPAPWRVETAGDRAVLTARSGPYRRAEALVLVPLTGPELVAAAKATGYVDPASLQLFEVREADCAQTPCDYRDSTLVFRLAGTTPPLATRVYHLYFSVIEARPAVADRYGGVLGADELLPGANLVANPSFEAPVRDAAGLVLTPAQVQEIEHTNLVPGGDLEGGEWALPAAAGPTRVALEKGVGREGSTGLVFEGRAAPAGPELQVVSLPFPVKPGALYQPRLWQWLDKPPPTGHASAFLLFLDADHKPINRTDTHSADKPSGDWRQLTYLGTAPATARFGQFQLVAGGLTDTRCVWDDLEVFERINPPDWTGVYHYYDPGMEAEVIGPDAADGTQAVRLSTTARGDRCTVGLVSKRFAIKPNTPYLGGCSIKVVEPAAVACSFAAYDRDGKPAMDSWCVFMAGGGVVGRWEEIRAGGPTKPTAAWGQMTISVGWGQGTVLYDNVFLREVPSGDPVKVALTAVERK